MSVKFKVIAAGIVFLAVSMFLYFTVRFKYVEEERIGSLVRSTNGIVREYHDMEKRMAGEAKAVSPDDLSAFLRITHKKYPQVALMAVTDNALSIRLSSKNDRYIRSAGLFEAILKDFTQDRFNITRGNPYAIRYYDEKPGSTLEQLKFYIFLSRIGGYRLLVVYPHTFGGPIRTRTVLEAALIAVCIIIGTAAVYAAAVKKSRLETPDEAHTIDLDLEGASLSREEGVSHDTANVVSDGLSGYVHELFNRINSSCDTDAISLYVFHPSGKLVKTMELAGETFLRIDSVSFDTIDVDNDAGRELRSGATMVLEEGRKIILPLVYNNIFLGAVNMEGRGGFQGDRIREITAAIAGMVKNIHDYIVVNDVMTDAGTGLHSRIYYNLKYNECVKAWKSKGKDFSLMFVLLSGEIGQMGDNEKNRIIKLIAPSITDIIKDDGYLCRHDDFLAVIMPDVNSRKAGGIEKRIRSALVKYRIKITDETAVRIDPAIGISSTDTAGHGDDLSVLAMRQITAQA